MVLHRSFTIDGKKIWFTEWVENNIGVIDTSISLPFSIDTDKQSITLEKGQTANIMLYVTSTTSDLSDNVIVNSSTTSTFSDIVVTSEQKELYIDDSSKTMIQITVSESALSGTHKVLLGAYNDDIAISKFITVIIE